jgi:hypothetical protein
MSRDIRPRQVLTHETRPNHSEARFFTMATRHLTPEVRLANEAILPSRDASGLLTLITVGLVLANVIVLAAIVGS